MSIKKKFLTLSISHQITLVIIIITIICLSTILAIFSLYSNIIISIKLRRRKKYIFQKFKEIVDSEIQFQTFLLYQYEQLIKGFNAQMYNYGHSQSDLYDTIINNSENPIKFYSEITEKEYEDNIQNKIYLFYLFSFSNDPYLNSNVYNGLLSTHSCMDNILRELRYFRIPYYGNDTRIINEYNFVLLNKNSLYSMNRTRIKEIEEISEGNISSYYNDLINNFVNEYKNFMNAYKRKELLFIDIFFNEKYYLFSNFINDTYIKTYYKDDIREYLNNISYYFNFIDYSTEKTFITDNGDKNKVNFLEQNTIIENYINFIFFAFHNNSNINVIPVFSKNNTIMSVNLCYSLLYKQMIFLNLTSNKNIFDIEKLNEIYEELKNNETNIGNCILDKKYNIKNDQNAYDILNIKFNKYYSVKNIREFSLFRISETVFGEYFFCTKITFPDIHSTLSFKPYFFTLEQLNLYCFKSFYEPKHFKDNMDNFFQNCQLFIILCIIYLWIVISFILFFRSQKLFVEIISPINNLIKVINELEIKKENILKYEADDSINELFKLCNDLLLGKYKQKMIHEFSEIEQNENNKKINDFNNLKINRKLIEEMIENKNEYKIKNNEIMKFKIDDNINNKNVIIKDNIKERNNLRKTTIINRKAITIQNGANIINNIETRVKKTQSIDHTISLLNKKLSYDVTLLNNSQNLITNQNEEDFLEMEILLNYKHLFDIVDLIFNYDFKYNKKFISKNSKLIYKTNKLGILSLKKKRSFSKGSERSRAMYEGQYTFKYNEKEDDLKNDTGIRIEDFDNSVINTYETKDLLFLWYKEAKFYNGVEFLQTNHTKELNNLCNLNINISNEKKRISDKPNINNNNKISNSPLSKKKVSILRKTNKEKKEFSLNS